jgi:solute carrier family 35, member E1
VSFAHVVKSAEPVFSVMLSGPILGATYPWCVCVYVCVCVRVCVCVCVDRAQAL